MQFTRGHTYPGLFVSFDGPDGCGKSTQQRKAADYLQKLGYAVTSARDPGGTIIGDKIRSILLDHGLEEMSHLTDLFLFETSRAQLVHQVITPVLKNGGIASLDRFIDSTTAYQGAEGEIPLEDIACVNRIATNGISPDLTFIFDIPIEEAFKRIGRNLDRIESRSLEFHRKVRQGYLSIAKSEPQRIKLIEVGDKTPEQIAEEVKADLDGFIVHYGLDKTLKRK